MGTGGLADIAFMVVDVLQKVLGTHLFRGSVVLCCRSIAMPAHGIFIST